MLLTNLSSFTYFFFFFEKGTLVSFFGLSSIDLIKSINKTGSENAWEISSDKVSICSTTGSLINFCFLIQKLKKFAFYKINQ